MPIIPDVMQSMNYGFLIGKDRKTAGGINEYPGSSRIASRQRQAQIGSCQRGTSTYLGESSKPVRWLSA